MSYYPHWIGIFCDICEETNEGDYLVSDDWTQEQRFACARRHLNTIGWRCDESGDFCPEHAAPGGPENTTCDHEREG